MDAFAMVKLLRSRQNAILESLPAELLAEYQELEGMVRHLDRILLKQGKDAQVELTPRLRQVLSEQENEAAFRSRVPLAERRAVLHEYLRSFGPSTRARILATTQIPPGTLSALLTESDCERIEGGLWRLRKKVTR